MRIAHYLGMQLPWLTRCAESQEMGDLGHAFVSQMYVGDGICIEIAIPDRPNGTIVCWGGLARGILVQQAISEENLLEEGQWQTTQIILGFVIGLEMLTITPPEHKVANASVFVSELLSKT